MSKKDYEVVARIIRSNVEPIQKDGNNDPLLVAAENVLDRIARQLAEAFKADNPHFNHEKFLLACGV
jgi:hypothetical protein